MTPRVLLLLLTLALTSVSTRALELRFVDLAATPVPGVVVWAAAAQSSVPAAAPAERRPTIVDQRDKQFVPFVSVVAPGTEVRFPNSDDIRHHVYSFSEGNRFERKLYRANDAAPVRFDTAGVVALGCNIHDNMEAYILVRDLPDAVVSDERGAASVTVQEPGTLQLWHPMLPEIIELPASGNRGGIPRTVTLPLTWDDPQIPRSVNELEQLLKAFSRDPE
jgi:plastocyanin